MIKYVTRIYVTENESQNYYHFHDNRWITATVLALAPLHSPLPACMLLAGCWQSAAFPRGCSNCRGGGLVVQTRVHHQPAEHQLRHLLPGP